MSGRPNRPLFDDALREAANGRLELTAKLLELPVEELASCDPEVWERIGPENRAKLLNEISGSPSSPQPEQTAAPVVHNAPNSRLVEFAWMFRLVPVPALGLIAGLICTTVCVGTAAVWLAIDPTLIAPVVTSDGECPRLMLPEGSCFYRVERDGLNWSNAARQIGVDEYALKAGNRDIAKSSLVRGSVVFISPNMAYGPKE